MITFLSYFTAILALVFIFQLMNIYQLASELKGENTGIANDRDNRSQGLGMLLFMPAFFIFLLTLIFIYKDKMLPQAASDVGKEADRLMNFNWVIIFIVFFITEALLFYFANRYKKGKDNSKAYYFPHQDKLELIWTIVPSIVLAVIIIYGLSLWGKMTGKPDKDAIVIQLYAKQFDFTARYSGHDNILGKTDYKLIDDATNPLGMDTTDAKGWDDIIVKGELHVPVNHQIDFKCNARDVMHGMYMPYFREQINCVPGITTDMHFIPTITTAQMRKDTHDTAFDYMLLCNRVCGAGHYNMQMKIVVDSPEEYYEWLAKQKTFRSNVAAK
ncbi:MAG: cytochrome c oxidase subunit II [Bacteroidia bacterium]|nr:cytochrome c oxidase subunit II [Bacteroidia bacterium]